LPDIEVITIDEMSSHNDMGDRFGRTALALGTNNDGRQPFDCDLHLCCFVPEILSKSNVLRNW